MTLPRELVERLERTLEEERVTLEQLKSGALKLRQRLHGKDWEDITADAIVQRERVIATYQEIIGRQGRPERAGEPQAKRRN